MHADDAVTPAPFPPLPVAVSSFGAVAADGWLYVYGGHVAPVHTYSTEAVSNRLDRLNLNDHSAWEKLPGGRGLQGLNLAAHGGKIYRIGGMESRNKPGETVDNHSVAEVAARLRRGQADGRAHGAVARAPFVARRGRGR